MALAPRDITITREQVSGWLNIHKNLPASNTQSLRDFLLARIAAAKLPDDQVDTSGSDTLADATPIVDMILMDLESYGR